MSLKKSPTTKFGITGGIGSGKSYVCRLVEAAGFPVFYCDDEAKRILRAHPLVHDELVRLVGPEVYAPDGRLAKAVLAEFLCRGREWAARVDAIVHPRVAEAFRRWCVARPEPKLFMECALLFEAGFDRLVDVPVLVSAPQELRVERVMQRDGVSRSKVSEWMALQMPEAEKRSRAAVVVVSDGVADLPAQVRSLLSD